jgi:hypothetical protein
MKAKVPPINQAEYNWMEKKIAGADATPSQKLN